jgi:hypothetical protein
MRMKFHVSFRIPYCIDYCTCHNYIDYLKPVYTSVTYCLD